MTTSRAVRFLVTSAGRRGELVEILREVVRLNGGGGGVYTVDRSPLTAAGWLSDGLDLVPPVADPAYVDALVATCVRREVTDVVPTIDTELTVLAAAKERFTEAGVRVWVSSPETVAIAQDKRATNRWLRRHAFPTVDQFELSSLGHDWIPEAPMIAKPARGSSSIGLRHLSTGAEVQALDRGLDYVVESIAPGREFTVDVLVDKSGTCRAAVPRERLETRSGEVSKGRTAAAEDLIELATAIAEKLPGAFGVLNIQVFRDDNDHQNVIEVNARFGGGFPLTWAAGCQMPLWLVRDQQGNADDSTLSWLGDQVMLRYDQGVYLDCRS